MENKIEKLRVLSRLLTVFVTLPIWYYILYQILTAINASELTWFLYWAYVPIGVFVCFVGALITEDLDG